MNRRRAIGLGLGGLAAAGAGGYWWYKGTESMILDASRSGVAGGAKPGNEHQPAAPKKIAASNPGEPKKPTEKLVLDPAREFAAADRPITKQGKVAEYVNYYEFNPYKAGTWRKAAALPVRPWTVEVGGLVQTPQIFDIDKLIKDFAQEQRVYRHRCVETWAMVVPWNGFPLRKLVEKVQPLDNAKYVRFVTADIQKLTGLVPPREFEWPYVEALTIAEAVNELAFIATGFYGEPLFKQNGAPVRLVAPWKYGFKSAKSIVRIEFVERKPATFWNTAAPHEYGFFANVNPEVDHPRWSQRTEWMIDTGERFPTKPYNGYERWVGELYTGNEV